jgi:hypothetical protein
MTPCDRCQTKTDKPNYMTLNHWGGGGLHAFLCDDCYAIAARILSIFFKPDPE